MTRTSIVLIALIALVAGCGAVQGAAPPLLPLAELVDSQQARARMGQRVRFYGVLNDLRALPTPAAAGRRYVAATVYGVRIAGDPPIPGRCDFGVRSGAVSVLIPASVAQPWSGRPRDTVFLFTARVEARLPGEPRWAPTPVWLDVDSLTAMSQCARPDPRIAPPSAPRLQPGGG